MTAQLLQFVTIGPWELNGFDIVVLIVLLISMLYAASRGFLREVISIAALLFAAIVTLFVWGQFRFAAQEFISPTWLADGALLIGVFFITYLLMALIMSKIGKSIAGKESGFLDRILKPKVTRKALLNRAYIMRFWIRCQSQCASKWKAT